MHPLRACIHCGKLIVHPTLATIPSIASGACQCPSYLNRCADPRDDPVKILAYLYDLVGEHQGTNAD